MVKTAAVIWYKANQSYVANTLCENRDQPELQCNGRCVLAKKIAAAEQRENNVPNPSQIQVKIEPCIIEKQHDALDDMLRAFVNLNFQDLKVEPSSAMAEGVFHPPQMV